MILNLEEYEIVEIKRNFTEENLNKALKNITNIVEKEFIGTVEKAENSYPYDSDVSAFSMIDMEGYWIIPGVAFDHGDTSSGGFELENCVPFGDKEEFKAELIRNINGMLEVIYQK